MEWKTSSIWCILTERFIPTISLIINYTDNKRDIIRIDKYSDKLISYCFRNKETIVSMDSHIGIYKNEMVAKKDSISFLIENLKLEQTLVPMSNDDLCTIDQKIKELYKLEDDMINKMK